MTNEEAQKIAALTEELVEMSITVHESEGRSSMLDASPTATYRQRLTAKQEATADRAVLYGIQLEILDAVFGVDNGE